MRVLAHPVSGRDDILVLEELATGPRSCYEAGKRQSYALPGRKIGLDHLALMARLLGAGETVLLIGCRGGTLATELHHQARKVTVVDANPLRFELAQKYFWMPADIRCVTVDPRRLLMERILHSTRLASTSAYEDCLMKAVLDRRVWARLRARLRAARPNCCQSDL